MALHKLADSNVVLRLLLNDIPDQAERAASWLEASALRTIDVKDWVLVEVLFILESQNGYGIPRKVFMSSLRGLLEAEYWYIEEVTWQALEVFTKTKFDYVDCLMIVAKKSGSVLEVLTFDKQLQKALNQVD